MGEYVRKAEIEGAGKFRMQEGLPSTCCDGRLGLYVMGEPLNSTPETNIAYYVY